MLEESVHFHQINKTDFEVFCYFENISKYTKICIILRLPVHSLFVLLQTLWYKFSQLRLQALLRASRRWTWRWDHFCHHHRYHHYCHHHDGDYHDKADLLPPSISLPNSFACFSFLSIARLIFCKIDQSQILVETFPEKSSSCFVLVILKMIVSTCTWSS